jgi:hypothetical protein
VNLKMVFIVYPHAPNLGFFISVTLFLSSLLPLWSCLECALQKALLSLQGAQVYGLDSLSQLGVGSWAGSSVDIQSPLLQSWTFPQLSPDTCFL